MQTAKSRIPWIIILIFMAMLVGSLISFFEETLQSVVLLAAFIPMIMALIPLIADKLNVDPAVASGPFITTINDALGLLIYFSIATSMLHLI